MDTGVKIADAMSQSPKNISEDASILDCAKVMLEKRVGSLLVINEEMLEGIITEKDVVRVIAKGLDPTNTTVGEIMSTRIHSSKPDDDLTEAMHHMYKNKVRRLPVIHKGKIVGIITMTDILRIQPALFELVLAKGIGKWK
jgi:signal-transduction protein with cAMP-binding, CBS, and nucleotidyltransferase domain